jgi:nicotinate-nucleotide adenylyltransferase
MRIGVFGGSFDPVHYGHLILAEQCREQAALDEVWFVPAARPPHKPTGQLTAFAQRVEMLALALAGQTAFRIDEIERDRPGPSYTADTLDQLHGREGGHEWYLLVGGDSIRDLPTWYEPERIVRRATLLVVGREGSGVATVADLEARLGTPVRLQSVDSPPVGIASSDLRRRIRAGLSIRYQTPRAVEAYIQEKRLYLGG